jgi:hypothetical protein
MASTERGTEIDHLAALIAAQRFFCAAANHMIVRMA